MRRVVAVVVGVATRLRRMQSCTQMSWVCITGGLAQLQLRLQGATVRNFGCVEGAMQKSIAEYSQQTRDSRNMHNVASYSVQHLIPETAWKILRPIVDSTSD